MNAGACSIATYPNAEREDSDNSPNNKDSEKPTHKRLKCFLQRRSVSVVVNSAPPDHGNYDNQGEDHSHIQGSANNRIRPPQASKR